MVKQLLLVVYHEEAKLLAQRLNAGALPVPIELVSQKTVGPSLGQKSIDMSIEAGALGLILVAIYMLIVYRLPGLVANVSLLLYGFIVLGPLSLLRYFDSRLGFILHWYGCGCKCTYLRASKRRAKERKISR